MADTTPQERNELRVLAANLENARFRELLFKLLGRDQEQTSEGAPQRRHRE